MHHLTAVHAIPSWIRISVVFCANTRKIVRNYGTRYNLKGAQEYFDLWQYRLLPLVELYDNIHQAQIRKVGYDIRFKTELEDVLFWMQWQPSPPNVWSGRGALYPERLIRLGICAEQLSISEYLSKEKNYKTGHFILYLCSPIMRHDIHIT